jgi:hypothetical protein
MDIICEKYYSCAVFKGVIRISQSNKEEYENNYCKSFEYVKCKRYLVYKKVGYCPVDVLPDSILSIREIIKSSRELVY